MSVYINGQFDKTVHVDFNTLFILSLDLKSTLNITVLLLFKRPLPLSLDLNIRFNLGVQLNVNRSKSNCSHTLDLHLKRHFDGGENTLPTKSH